MKWKRLIALAVIFEATILLAAPTALNAQGETPFISDQISREETKIFLEESAIFGQILFLYATEALEKPPDLRLCAYEMFRLKPNENSCRDKHSAWHSKEEYELFESDIEGKFGGVGLEVADRDGKVVVVSPIDGTPAFRAGFKPEDVIVKVDNKPVLNLMDAVTRLRGKPGASVKITVKRDEREISFNVVREVIIVHAVSAKTINSPSGAIGYVKVKTFSEIMPEEFRKEIIKLRDQGVNKVILNFRNDPGGLLWSALDILYDFARPGDVSMVMRERNKETVFDTNYVASALSKQREPGMFRDLKIVVLINKGSASASEIFAGAMKDWGFPVVGSRSFGKGVGQTLFPLANGSKLRLTTFEFLVGNSKTKINDVGVIPNYEVPDPAPSPAETLREDKQLEKAIEILSR
ncbi:MAG: S41 family peptidase [bacterium]|nr:S41 family peptidase [bacterium]